MRSIWRAAVTGLALASSMSAATSGPLPMTAPRAAAIDAAVHAGMARVGAKGLALAVVEDGKVVLTRAYGLRTGAGAPLATDSIMYGASLTKAVFAYTVMRLVDEGKVDLDAPIAAMLARPLPDYGNMPANRGNWADLADEPRWRAITPRMALTHSTGFANFFFLEPDQKARIHFAPGTRYAYSGQGLTLLQFAIEQKLGHGIEVEAQRLTFGPLGMADTTLSWNPGQLDRAAGAWDAEGKAYGHRPNSRVGAAGSMDTTIADMARFAAALVSGTGLSRRAHDEMLRPQRPITTASQFPTLQDELPPARRRGDLSAGLGVVTFAGPQGPGFYKGGHDDKTGNTMVCVRSGKRCVILLSNDVRSEKLFPDLVRTVLGETGVPYRWEYPEQFAP